MSRSQRRPKPPSANAPGTIRLENVSFRYPGSPRLALDGFDLTLPAGRIVAIVGENGAGKSTLLKLLCRFYDPEGRVSWDGIDLRELALTDWRRRITVLFQEPVHYHDTVAYNIACGDLAVVPDMAAIAHAAHAAGAEGSIQRLPQSYATVLGKWFGGAELSVGEWRRLALARAFLRRSALLILDEPTSAMDSWAEADWLVRFRDLAAGRTALVITHRFTTALHADVIHVMGAGPRARIRQSRRIAGTGGRYAQSWTQQLRETGKVGWRTLCEGGLPVARSGCTIFVCWPRPRPSESAEVYLNSLISIAGCRCGCTHAGLWRTSGNFENPERCYSMSFVSTRIAQALRELATESPVSLRVSGECMVPLLANGAMIQVVRQRFYWPGDLMVSMRRMVACWFTGCWAVIPRGGDGAG